MVTPDPADVQRAVGADYEVLELVNTGGQGAVFRARYRELGNLVAIKVLHPEIAASKVRQERFRREAELAAHLSHPNVVPVTKFEPRAELPYLVMPFVRGGRTLKTLLAERSRLPISDLFGILQDVGSALDFIHPRGVVHRDVKPGNILIEEETERALLTDFGVALAGISGGSLTGPEGVVGTPLYMPPEQSTGAARVDGRADLYSLALVAFEALDGELPAAGLDRGALATALRQRNRHLSPALATALVAPLAERPDDRPPSAAAWLEGIRSATARRRWKAVVGVAAIIVLAVSIWIAVGHSGPRPGTERSLAVMPFTILGTNAEFPPAQLPTFFQSRLGSVPGLRVMSSASVASTAGEVPQSTSDAQTTAASLGAAYFIQPSLMFLGNNVRMSARLYQTSPLRLLAPGEQTGPVDSLSPLMDAVWAQLLKPIVRGNFAPVSAVTMPNNLAAMLAYASAEEAFRSGDFNQALDDYDRLLRADSTFAIGYFRRAIVLAQIDPREEVLREAIAGARQHPSGLTPADSVMLDGYRLMLEQGDGRTALQRFKSATALAPDEPNTWFVLGLFYYHFGALFDQRLTDAEDAFDKVLVLSPNYAPAIAKLISLAYQRGDKDATRQYINQYERFGTSSVVAEAIGIADTLLFHTLPAKLALKRTLESHSFTALEYLAFQVQEFATPADRRGPGRDVLRAVERRAATDSQQVLALRLGVVADLAEGWVDSARARLARVHTPATERERDMWLVLLPATGLDSLGPWREAAARLDAGIVPGHGGEIIHWMLARLGPDRTRHAKALDRLARDSSPLPLSLQLDLQARTARARGDTVEALELWQLATQRYAVLRVPFDLAASLWWLRRDLARVALAHHDTRLAALTCDSFTSPNGYVDLLVLRQKDQFCPPAITTQP